MQAINAVAMGAELSFKLGFECLSVRFRGRTKSLHSLGEPQLFKRLTSHFFSNRYFGRGCARWLALPTFLFAMSVFAASNSQPKIISSVKPEYPPSEKRAGHEGKTIVTLRVLANGSIENPRVLQSSGWPSLDDAALASIYQWTFEPARDDSGHAIDANKVVALNFELTNPGAMDQHTSQLLDAWSVLQFFSELKRVYFEHCGPLGVDLANSLRVSEGFDEAVLLKATHVVPLLVASLPPKDQQEYLQLHKEQTRATALQNVQERMTPLSKNEQVAACELLEERLRQPDFAFARAMPEAFHLLMSVD